MTRALIAVGVALVLAFAGLGLVVYLAREEEGVGVDNIVSLELTRAIGVAGEEGGEVDLRTLAPGSWDRVIVAPTGTPADAIADALGAPFTGDTPNGGVGELLVFADGSELVRFADYRGRAAFTGFDRPVAVLARDEAVLDVRGLVVRPG